MSQTLDNDLQSSENEPQVDPSKKGKWPAGIPYIIGNEAAERYSFYGMKAILVIFLMYFIRNAEGHVDVFSKDEAKFWFHLFVFGAYGFSLLGSFLADIWLGKYRTIIYLSIVYCIGHFVLALFETHMGFLVGCTLIAIGAGGIKPCVSAHVGDQFEGHNKHLFEKIFLYFYLSINAGAFIAYATAEPLLRNEYLIEKGLNATVAFGLPGLLMVAATVIFWMGRKHFISIKPVGFKFYVEEIIDKGGWKVIVRILPIYFFLMIFFSLFDQTGAAWVQQADSDLMTKTINLGFTTVTVLPSQIGFVNPLLIIAFILLFTHVIYPAMRKFMKVTYMNKMAIGMFIAVFSFGLLSWVQAKMDGGQAMSISWQIWAYVIITIAEVMISITALEFSYTQAPNSMKSFIMSFYLLAVAFANLFTAIVNWFIQNPDGTSKLAGADYFWFFTYLMLGAAVVFLFVSRYYKEHTYVQSRENAE